MPQRKPAAGPGLSYRQAGVDVAAAAALVERIKPLARATARAGTSAELGGFGGLFDLKAAGFRDPLLVAATDGVGTKLKIAIESGRHESIGIDLVAMCVNDLVVQGAEPLFFLDYFACGRLDAEVAEAVVAGIAEGCRQAGAALIGGETAEMPGVYAGGDYDLAGFAVGAVERGAALPRDDICPGDRLIALASSGPHSNGYSLIRRILAEEGLGPGDPAPFADGPSLGEALLVPTRIHVPALLAMLRSEPGRGVKALAHVTGGGLPENLPRVLPADLAARIDLAVLAPQPVFAWIAQAGGISDEEMLATFNCGAGMVAVSAPGETQALVAALANEGEVASEIGEIVPRGDGPGVRFEGKLRL